MMLRFVYQLYRLVRAKSASQVWTAEDAIQVFERSSFHNEAGAAIHLAPNATRVLTAWGRAKLSSM